MTFHLRKGDIIISTTYLTHLIFNQWKKGTEYLANNRKAGLAISRFFRIFGVSKDYYSDLCWIVYNYLLLIYTVLCLICRCKVKEKAVSCNEFRTFIVRKQPQKLLRLAGEVARRAGRVSHPRIIP